MGGLGSLEPTQLLMLMTIPIIGALVILALTILYVFRSRGSSGKMKHGIEIKEDGTSEEPNDDGQTQGEAAPSGVSAATRGEAENVPGRQDAVEVLRILYDEKGIILEVEGRRYRDLNEVRDMNTGQSILESVSRLLQFTNGLAASDDGVQSVAVPSLRGVPFASYRVKPDPKPEAVPAPPAPKPEAVPAPPVKTAPPAPKPPAPPPPVEPRMPSPDAELEVSGEDFLRRLEGQTKTEEPERAAPKRSRLSFMMGREDDSPGIKLNLAEEINEIFQRKLAESPLGTFVSASIDSGPDGGIRIEVDGVYYDGPDEVKDPVIRDMIKSAIKEWEKS